MNEGVVSALMTGGMPVLAALLTLLVAQWFNAKSQAKQVEERRTERRDNDREWYRRTLFEKRLAAVQEAYAWLQKIKEAIDNANPNDPQSEANDVLRKTAREAREWYDNNTIFFHDELPEGSLFIGLINSSFGYSYGRTPLKVQPHLTVIASGGARKPRLSGSAAFVLLDSRPFPGPVAAMDHG